MRKKIALLMMILVLILTACSGSVMGSTSTVVSQAQTSNTVEAVETDTGTAPVSSVETLAANQEINEDESDYTWDSSAVVSIQLNGDSITADAAGVTVHGSTATITSAGTYSLSGTLRDGQIIVDSADKAVVRLILNGVNLSSATSAPIYVANAERTVIVLAENSQNTVTDGAAYVFASADEDEPNAAIFSKSDLTFFGSGLLSVSGNYNDGIASKDGLILASGTISVSAVDDGIRGKDYVAVKDGSITIQAGGDGLKSDNEENATRGYVSIENGVLNITAGGDAITAQTDVVVTGGEITLTTAGGSGSQIDETLSAKGIKGVVGVNIDGGIFNIDSADDAIHSNGNVVINAGEMKIASGDDGMHADETLAINGGSIDIRNSYEGLESAVITINAGTIHVNARDDGINVAGGNDASGMNPGMGGPGGQWRPGGGGPRGQGQPGGQWAPGGGPGQDAFTYSGDYYLYVHGGYIVVESAGDGIDVNGAIEMTGGVVLVNGPIEQMNGALDYDGTFNITGGFFVAAGSAGMAQAPSTTSSQYSVLINFSTALPAGRLVHIQNSTGEEVLTFAPSKQIQSIVFSSPDLANGETYLVCVGGSSSGPQSDGLYQGRAYTQGDQYTSFTISSVVTAIGSGGMRPQ